MAQLGPLACALACAAGVSVPASRARACSGWLCSPSIYFPAEGAVPANLPGFHWWPGRLVASWEDAGTWDDEADLPGLLRFARVDGASPEWLEVELRAPDDAHGPYLVVPKEPLVEGGEYVLWDATECSAQPYALDTPPTEEQWLERAPSSGWPGGIAHVRATARAPLPKELGTLDAAEPTMGIVSVAHDASCSFGADALYVELTIAHDAAARPWRDALAYATEVDDEAYAPYGDYNQEFYSFDFEPGTSFVGRALDRVYTTCEPQPYSEGVEQGAHRARIRATVPGTELRLETNEVSFTLSCPAPQDGGTGTRDAGSDAGSDAGRDAAAGSMDASVEAGAPHRLQARRVRSEDEGCGVAHGGRTAWPLVLALAWLARRRDRRG